MYLCVFWQGVTVTSGLSPTLDKFHKLDISFHKSKQKLQLTGTSISSTAPQKEWEALSHI